MTKEIMSRAAVWLHVIFMRLLIISKQSQMCEYAVQALSFERVQTSFTVFKQ